MRAKRGITVMIGLGLLAGCLGVATEDAQGYVVGDVKFVHPARFDATTPTGVALLEFTSSENTSFAFEYAFRWLEGAENGIELLAFEERGSVSRPMPSAFEYSTARPAPEDAPASVYVAGATHSRPTPAPIAKEVAEFAPLWTEATKVHFLITWWNLSSELHVPIAFLHPTEVRELARSTDIGTLTLADMESRQPVGVTSYVANRMSAGGGLDAAGPGLTIVKVRRPMGDGTLLVSDSVSQHTIPLDWTRNGPAERYIYRTEGGIALDLDVSGIDALKLHVLHVPLVPPGVATDLAMAIPEGQ